MPTKQTHISYSELLSRVTEIFTEAGTPKPIAEILARNCVGCERDGATSHGIFRIPGYLSSIRSGWANTNAKPLVSWYGGGFVRVDGVRGFAQPALAAATKTITQAVKTNGVVVVTIRNVHHYSALWPDLEPFAEQGLVALTMVTGAAAVIPRGANKKMLGTNPFGFATPVAGAKPLVMDFATSSMSHGDLQLAAGRGESVPLATGTGALGQDSTDPQEILTEGGLLPFGGHKGLALSIMVEILASGLSDSGFSYRDDLILPPTAEAGGTDITGQTFIILDPERDGTGGFAKRVRELIDALRDSGVDRLPAERRYRQRDLAAKQGIPLTSAMCAIFPDLG